MDLELWRIGSMIPGASSRSGARKVSYDKEIQERTGLTVQGEEKPKVEAKPSKANTG